MSLSEKIDCCSDSNRILLERLSEKLGLSVEDLKSLVSTDVISATAAQRCTWIYKRSTKKYKTGDRCGSFSVGENVFCKKHSARAVSNNCYLIAGGTTTHIKYIPEVGTVEIKKFAGKEVSTSTATLIQGDFDKFSSGLTAGKYLEYMAPQASKIS